MIVVIIITAILAVLAIALGHKYGRTLPTLSTLVVLAEVAGALRTDEVQFSGWFAHLSLLNIGTYAQKWELFAIVASIFLVGFYWWDQMRSHKQYASTPLFGLLNVLLFLSIAALVVAVVYIKSSNGVHFFSIWLVALFFLSADVCTWRGVDELVAPEKKGGALKFIFFADVPVFVSFSVLAYFYFVRHWQQHTAPFPWLIPLPDGTVLNTYDYFLAGAIAFQYLASNIIFLVILWSSSPKGEDKAAPSAHSGTPEIVSA